MASIQPFGLWPSPLQADDLAQNKRLRDVAWDSDGKTLVWLEGRGDRGVLVCQPPGQAPRDLNATLSVRARVGYGGGDFSVGHGRVFFVEDAGRLYVQDLEAGAARPLTPDFGHAAAPAVSRDNRWLVYVHTDADIDRLAIVDTDGTYWPQHLVTGADFYMQPTWHPGGRLLAWIEWDHPQMPWDGSRLCLGQLKLPKDGLPQLISSQPLAGTTDTAIFQPQFSPDGRFLAYVSDQSGYSELYLYNIENGEHIQLTSNALDIAVPAWVQGMRVFAFGADSRHIFFTRSNGGTRCVYAYNLDDHQVHPLEALADYTYVEQLTAAPRGQGLACIASSSHTPSRIVCCQPPKEAVVIARSATEHIRPADLATPQNLTWETDDTKAHGVYYPPTSTVCSGQGLPPAIVLVHGGPTGQSTSQFEGRNQFFATRGYAVLDVNYRGSTGYGRHYMEALRGHWGIYDVEDVLNGANHLVEAGLADPDRLVIMGGSAGGYTVLRALTAKPGAFKAGICLYGISNLFTLATDTHKFESRYLDALIGPFPEAGDLYRQRSPIFAVEALRDPVAIFQGAEDRVVPLEQAQTIVESLRQRGVAHEYHVYEGEGHGWRRPETIAAFYRAVEGFLKQYVLFT